MVAKTVTQFFAKNRDRAYDESGTEEKTAEERSVAHGSDIQNGERRADSQPDNTTAGGSLSGQIRTAAESISEGAEYTTLKTTCRLTQHLAETEQNAKKMAEQLITKMAQEQKINEEMKEKNPLEWAAAMNNLKHSAEETVLRELIYK